MYSFYVSPLGEPSELET